MAAKPIPEGQHSITPYLGINDAAKAIEFYKKAFGAVEMFRLDAPGGRVGHAELKIGDSSLMLGDPCDMEGGLTVYAQALACGATQLREVTDQFYGDRSGTLKDPFGNIWFVSTHKEDLSPDEIRARAAQMFSGN